jgi:hypothetical protein
MRSCVSDVSECTTVCSCVSLMPLLEVVAYVSADCERPRLTRNTRTGDKHAKRTASQQQQQQQQQAVLHVLIRPVVYTICDTTSCSIAHATALNSRA